MKSKQNGSIDLNPAAVYNKRQKRIGLTSQSSGDSKKARRKKDEQRNSEKALLLGFGSGVLTWVIYALVFEMLIEHKPAKEAFFSLGNIIFLVIVTIVEIISYYFSLRKKQGN